MSFKDNLRVLVSYLRQFPTPTFLEKHTRLETSYFELKDSIRELERENKTLKQRLHSEGAFSRQNGACFFETPDGRQEPFCSRCWDLESKLVPLPLADEGMAPCPRCKNRASHGEAGTGQRETGKKAPPWSEASCCRDNMVREREEK